ncbi:MAG: tRNA (guanosine(46)-N7)-methyltransferase TrmB [Deltaproteobacteria bacterium]|nr:tRNA (guanosine(46)-N7)-methyltransferase TrmB [Deltaproteobacteria bacterium]
MKYFHTGKHFDDREKSLIGGFSNLRKKQVIPADIAGVAVADSSDSSRGILSRFDPVDIEIGCGKGGFLLNYAAAHPDRRIAGIEVRHNLAVSLARKITSLEIRNILVIRMDAREALSAFFVPASIERCFILFPDPWWKRTHVKKRLATENFARKIFAVLKENGHIFFATDVLHLSDLFGDCFSGAGFLASRGFNANLPETDREKAIRKRDGDIFYYTFVKP